MRVREHIRTAARVGLLVLLLTQVAGLEELGVSWLANVLFGDESLDVVASIIALIVAATVAHRIAFGHTGRVLIEVSVLVLHLISVLFLLVPIEIVVTRLFGVPGWPVVISLWVGYWLKTLRVVFRDAWWIIVIRGVLAIFLGLQIWLLSQVAWGALRLSGGDDG